MSTPCCCVQKEAAALREEAQELRAQQADLEEQVAEATTQLKIETENRVNAQDEVGRVSEALEATMSSCEQLRRQYEDQGMELDERSSQVRLNSLYRNSPIGPTRHASQGLHTSTQGTNSHRALRLQNLKQNLQTTHVTRVQTLEIARQTLEIAHVCQVSSLRTVCHTAQDPKASKAHFSFFDVTLHQRRICRKFTRFSLSYSPQISDPLD